MTDAGKTVWLMSYGFEIAIAWGSSKTRCCLLNFSTQYCVHQLHHQLNPSSAMRNSQFLGRRVGRAWLSVLETITYHLFQHDRRNIVLCNGVLFYICMTRGGSNFSDVFYFNLLFVTRTDDAATPNWHMSDISLCKSLNYVIFITWWAHDVYSDDGMLDCLIVLFRTDKHRNCSHFSHQPPPVHHSP